MAGKQRKAKKGRRNHDKHTGVFAFTFLTITSFPATHGIGSKSSPEFSLQIFFCINFLVHCHGARGCLDSDRVWSRHGG